MSDLFLPGGNAIRPLLYQGTMQVFIRLFDTHHCLSGPVYLLKYVVPRLYTRPMRWDPFAWRINNFCLWDFVVIQVHSPRRHYLKHPLLCLLCAVEAVTGRNDRRLKMFFLTFASCPIKFYQPQVKIASIPYLVSLCVCVSVSLSVCLVLFH